MNLIISPHIDDEVIGCGGMIDKCEEASYVYFCGVEDFHEISQYDRLKEVKDVSEFLSYECEVNLFSVVNGYKVVDFIDIFQEVIKRVKPDKIFIPYASYNQDHQAVYHAAMIALRPHDRNFFVKKVLTYEGIGAFQWMNNDYKVNHFVPINVDTKELAYGLHKSQVREFRSMKHVRALAELRGSQIGVPYAEAFIIERWVE
ncbi:MAG: hypothetical protein GOV02_03095 [Candidatus Aenigmarchaeota archaeon]|nr:hypothetical protein [Candidatus Aenigmarchaeota archaeon]